MTTRSKSGLAAIVPQITVPQVTLPQITLPRPVAEAAARAAGWVSRRLGRGGGTTLPGVVLLRLRPNAIAEAAGELRHGSVLISATNGKTTTTRLVSAACRAVGYRPVTNTEGSNLERGVAAALLHAPDGADLGVFEVDEAALPAVAHATVPGVVVLMNLFRDQLDRYGELETLVDTWAALLDRLDAVPEPPILVLNADDPNIAALGRDRANVVWFGVDDVSHAVATRDLAADATSCRRCGGPLEHRVALIGHLGHWHCPRCGATRPAPQIAAAAVRLHPDGQEVTVRFPAPQAALAAASDPAEIVITSRLPGLHNAYNITAAYAASWALAQRSGRHAPPDAVAAAIAVTEPAFGRGEIVEIGDTTLQLLLAKNPTGVNQNVRTILGAPGDLDVLVMLNDRTADGQDVSWIWDVEWEVLQPRIRSLTLGGDRAWDLALRFRYGGFDMDRVEVAPDPAQALDAALAAAGNGRTVFALPTYTAMLDLRGVLTARGFTRAYWSNDT